MEPRDPTPEVIPSDSEKSSLRRELLAILVLYAVAVILPVLIGLALGPTSG